MKTQLPINSAEDALKLGQIIARSGMFACPNDENGAAIALFCYQDGISLFEFQRCYHMLDGKPTMKVDAMLAKLLELGGCYEIISRTDKIASIRVNRKDGPQHDFTVTYDEVVSSGVALKKNGSLKDQYRIRPKNMIWARVASDAIRTIEPRVNAGLYTTEEMEDAQEDGGTTTPPNVALPELVAPINYSVIPEGLPGAGDSWLGRSHNFLTAVLANPASLTEKHLESVQSALDQTPF